MPVMTDRGSAAAALRGLDELVVGTDRLLSEAGVAPPEPFVSLSAAFRRLISYEAERASQSLGGLLTVLGGGRAEQIPAAFDRAVAAAVAADSVLLEAAESLVRPLGDAASAAASFAHSEVAARFNDAAAELAAAQEVADVNAGHRKMMFASELARKGWAAAEDICGRLEAGWPPVVRAAFASNESPGRLEGVNEATAGPLLCTSAARLTPELSAAWNDGAGHRLGRWGALLELGVTIEARPLSRILADSQAAA